MKTGVTRLVLEIDPNLHFAIKKQALDKNISMKTWILMAVASKMREEQKGETDNE